LKINNLITLIFVVVWIASPVFALADGSIFDDHSNVAEVAKGRAVLAAVQAVDTSDMQSVSADAFLLFAKSHINFDTNSDGHHGHTSFDACCGFGGLVCDSGLVPDHKFDSRCSHTSWAANNLTALASVDIPTLRHPPKRHA